MGTRDRSFSTQFVRFGLVLALAFASGACAQSLEEAQGDASAPEVVTVADAEDASCTDDGGCGEIEWIDPIDDAGEPDDAAVIDDDASVDVDAEVDVDVTEPDDASIDDSGAARETGASVTDSGTAAFVLPTCSNVDRRLREDFGIVIRPGTTSFEGLPSEDIGCEDRIKVYQMFMRPFRYARYPRRVDITDPFTMQLYRSSSAGTGRCSAYTPNAQNILIRDLRSCLHVVSGTSDPDFLRVATFLIHETGHIIMARHYSLQTAFNDAHLPSLDPRCYDRGFLKTYSLRTTNAGHESFAEAQALFIANHKVGVYATITDFRTECPHTYAWVRDNIFGDRL